TRVVTVQDGNVREVTSMVISNKCLLLLCSRFFPLYSFMIVMIDNVLKIINYQSSQGIYQPRFSYTMAAPWPTPMHIVASPYLPLRFFSSYSRVVDIRVPLQPRGWPNAI